MPRKWIVRVLPKSKKETCIGSFDPISFESVCRDDLDAARNMLTRDYQELLEDFESRVSQVREEIVRFGSAMSTKKELDQNELQLLRERYDQLRRLLRRLEASIMQTRELKEEAADWEQRRGEGGPRHADHPEVRVEIARSELRVRADGCMTNIPKSATVVEARNRSSKQRGRMQEDVRALLQAIQHTTREAEQWHDVPYPSEDAAEHVRNVRELHALLKQIDRESGTRRHRLPLGLRMRSFID